LATEKRLSITSVCRQLGYSKQAYYKSLKASRVKHYQKQEAKQKVLLLRRSMPRLGTRKLYYLLKKDFVKERICIGRDRLFDLLREEGLLINKKKRYTKTTNSKHWMHKYPNLIKETELTRPEQIWVADITYLAVGEGFHYLHLITDAYSKQIMGYCLDNTLAASATVKALQMAIKARRYDQPLIHHSDRGLQYCSAQYTQLLAKNGIEISMTQDGSPYDNAVAERVNGILKDEFGLDEAIENEVQTQKQVNQAIATYNMQRPHMSNQYLTPHQMHQQKQIVPKTWHKKTTKTFAGDCGFIS
jgi:putative transposase